MYVSDILDKKWVIAVIIILFIVLIIFLFIWWHKFVDVPIMNKFEYITGKSSELLNMTLGV